MLSQGLRSNRRVISAGEEESNNNTEVRSKAAEDRPARVFHFRSLADKLKYEEICDRRKTVPGRVFDESFLREIKFTYLERLQKWGWMPFITMTRPSYHNLVKYFYYNARLEELDDNYQPIPRTLEVNGFHTYAHNKHFNVTDADVWEALGGPRNKPNVGSYHRKSFRHLKGCRIIYNDPGIQEIISDVNRLSFHDRILHLMVCQTINPRQGSFSTITLEDIWLMTMIILNRPPNLHEYVMGKLKKTIRLNKRKSKMGLLYGKLVSDIIDMKLGKGVSDSQFDPETKAPFGKATVKQTGFRCDKLTGEWYRPKDEPMEIDEDDQDAEDEELDILDEDSEDEDSEEEDSGEEPLGDEDDEFHDQQHHQVRRAHRKQVIDEEMRDVAADVEPSQRKEKQKTQKSAGKQTNSRAPTHNAQTDANPYPQIKQYIDALGVHVASGFRGINARLFEMENNQQTIATALRAVQVRVGIDMPMGAAPPAQPESSNAQS